jgi:uncharacterized protein YrzB (UPF0473 family)
MSDTLDFTPDLYTLVDEEGKEQTFELLDVMEVNDQRYFAMVPYYPEASELLEGDGELVILKSQFEGDEEILVSIDDDKEFDRIGLMFMKRIETMFEDDFDDDFDDDDEDGCGDEGCGCNHHHLS